MSELDPEAFKAAGKATSGKGEAYRVTARELLRGQLLLMNSLELAVQESQLRRKNHKVEPHPALLERQ